MIDDQFDALVDDATHSVNNLIPDRWLTCWAGPTDRTCLSVSMTH
ncbi:hypothetical protein BHE75_03611 [Sphingomonas haloaromaticamans]|uniref:Uncharacterized protein n=1 Tax=Edaphosphingomonas haloaromaticamans TaxID=653954 RepID=A0A1S1HM69_9SPHN|nr:hypothetical protein BHE75_03611 [Sphingomonas haloaromaticamans]